MNVSEIKKAGAAIGAEYETSMAAVAGGLVSQVLPIMRDLPQGKASAMMSAFWEQFAANAPVYGGAKRVKVTKSESLRLAAGIDAGLDVSTGGWNELVKAAPKKASGPGVRPPRVPAAKPETDAETVTLDAEKPATPTAMIRQLNAAQLAICAANKDRLAIALFNAVQAVSAVLAGIPEEE